MLSTYYIKLVITKSQFAIRDVVVPDYKTWDTSGTDAGQPNQRGAPAFLPYFHLFYACPRCPTFFYLTDFIFQISLGVFKLRSAADHPPSRIPNPDFELLKCIKIKLIMSVHHISGIIN